MRAVLFLALMLPAVCGAGPGPSGGSPPDAIRVQTDLQKFLRNESEQNQKILTQARRYFTERFTSYDLGLFGVPIDFQYDVEALWRIGQGASGAGRAELDAGSWKGAPEYPGFLLYAANELWPRLRVVNYVGEMVLAPPMEELIGPADALRILGLPFDWATHRKVRAALRVRGDPTEFLVDTLYAARSGQLIEEARHAKKYGRLRTWQTNALERQIFLDQRFQKFSEDAKIRWTVFEAPVPRPLERGWTAKIEEAQRGLPEGSIYRIVRNERGAVEGRIVLPLNGGTFAQWGGTADPTKPSARAALDLRALTEAARATRVPMPDEAAMEKTLSDAHIRELLMAAGIGGRHALKSSAARAAAGELRKLPGLLLRLKDRALFQDPALCERLRKLRLFTEQQIREQAQVVARQETKLVTGQRALAERLARIRGDSRLRIFLSRLTPSRKTLAAAGEVRAPGGMSLATPLAIAGIAAVLALDIADAGAAAHTAPFRQDVEKKVARILVDAGIGIGLWVSRGNPVGLAIWGGILAASIAQATIHPDIPTLTDATDLLSGMAADWSESLRWLFGRGQWISQPRREWNRLREKQFPEIVSVDPRIDVSALTSDAAGSFEKKRNVYRLSFSEFEKELTQLPAGAYAAQDRLAAAYARGYLRILLAGLQFASLRPIPVTPIALGARGCLDDDVRARLAIPQALTREIRAFSWRVTGLQRTRPAIPGGQAELAEMLLRVAYELKLGAEVGEDGELHLNPDADPTAEQRAVAEVLIRAYRALQRG